MAHIDLAQFEALWEKVKIQPQVRKAAPVPVQTELSLTAVLNQYVTMAAAGREWGKISAQDYNDLANAVNALKAVLARINDQALVAAAVAQNAVAIQQKLSKPKS